MSISNAQIAQISENLNVLARYLALDDFGGSPPTEDDLHSVGVIALFGNHGEATLTRACTLAQITPHSKLLFSGGIGHSTRLLYRILCTDPYLAAQSALSPDMSEADMYSAVAQSIFDIPADRILVENRSANAGENAQFSIRALKNAGLSTETVVLLQDPTMQRRAILTWQRQAELAGIEARLLSHSAFVPSVVAASDGTLRVCPDQGLGSWSFMRLAALLLGEIRRLRDDENGYGPRGLNFIAHVDIPDAVLESYARLITSDLIQSLEQSGDVRR
jgi:uncharacterized SAM-binding protein YcdF (DUF218 family)